jgi:hypothetical protein
LSISVSIKSFVIKFKCIRFWVGQWVLQRFRLHSACVSWDMFWGDAQSDGWADLLASVRVLDWFSSFTPYFSCFWIASPNRTVPLAMCGVFAEIYRSVGQRQISNMDDSGNVPSTISLPSTQHNYEPSRSRCCSS